MGDAARIAVLTEQLYAHWVRLANANYQENIRF